MKLRYDENPDWFKALTLSERQVGLEKTPKKFTKTDFDSKRAEWHMERWRAQSPFDNKSALEHRLKVDKLTEKEFSYLLGEPVEFLRNRQSSTPNWLTDLIEAFSETESRSRARWRRALRGLEVGLRPFS